jgi:hypothetical protein
LQCDVLRYLLGIYQLPLGGALHVSTEYLCLDECCLVDEHVCGFGKKILDTCGQLRVPLTPVVSTGTAVKPLHPVPPEIVAVKILDPRVQILEPPTSFNEESVSVLTFFDDKGTPKKPPGSSLGPVLTLLLATHCTFLLPSCPRGLAPGSLPLLLQLASHLTEICDRDSYTFATDPFKVFLEDRDINLSPQLSLLRDRSVDLQPSRKSYSSTLASKPGKRLTKYKRITRIEHTSEPPPQGTLEPGPTQRSNQLHTVSYPSVVFRPSTLRQMAGSCRKNFHHPRKRRSDVSEDKARR